MPTDEILSLQEELEVRADELREARDQITVLSRENAQLRALAGEPPALTFLCPGNRVVVERVAERDPVGIIVAVGPDAHPMFGIGAKVLCSTYAGTGFTVNGRTYVAVKEDDIVVCVPTGCRVNLPPNTPIPLVTP
jgi:hypothetical protein